MKRIITALGTCASIISLAFIPGMPNWARWLVGIFGVVCMVILAYDEIKSNRPDENETLCTDDAEIKTEMIKLIKYQGKICIMSRDLSWVDQEVMNCITGKKDNVKIFAQSENETTKELVAAGVTVKYYGGTGFEPATRFTMLRYNKTDRQVAISRTSSNLRKKKGKFEHVIYLTGGKRSDKRDGWITSLALDLIELCDNVSKNGLEVGDGTKKPQKEFL